MTKTIAALALMALLSGCQSIFGRSEMPEITMVGVVSPDARIKALEEGRQALRAGDPGSAIVSLQIAATNSALAADAHNGLGVAYAMIGRGDLAERYFLQAIAERPAEEKYAANLARYYRSREAAVARMQAPVADQMPRADLPTENAFAGQPTERVMLAGPGTVRITMPTRTAAITRVSRGEVAIQTQPAISAKSANSGTRRTVRMANGTLASKTVSYPVRIDLATIAPKQ